MGPIVQCPALKYLHMHAKIATTVSISAQGVNNVLYHALEVEGAILHDFGQPQAVPINL